MALKTVSSPFAAFPFLTSGPHFTIYPVILLPKLGIDVLEHLVFLFVEQIHLEVGIFIGDLDCWSSLDSSESFALTVGSHDLGMEKPDELFLSDAELDQIFNEVCHLSINVTVPY